MYAMKPAVPLLVVIIVATPGSVWAQAGPDAPRDPSLVQPERPTVATHAGTVARGWVELEEGGEWDKELDGRWTFFAPTNLKIGLSQRMQANILINLIHDSEIAGGSFAAGDLTVGLKYRLMEGHWLLGDFAILPAIKIPTASASEAGTGTIDFSLLLISSRQLGPVAMDLNVGGTRRGGATSSIARTATVWTASFGMGLIGRLGGVLEFYGYPKTAAPLAEAGSVAILVGPTFLVRKSLALDAGIIAPLDGPQPHALYVGFVWNAGPVFARTPR